MAKEGMDGPLDIIEIPQIFHYSVIRFLYRISGDGLAGPGHNP